MTHNLLESLSAARRASVGVGVGTLLQQPEVEVWVAGDSSRVGVRLTSDQRGPLRMLRDTGRYCALMATIFAIGCGGTGEDHSDPAAGAGGAGTAGTSSLCGSPGMSGAAGSNDKPIPDACTSSCRDDGFATGTKSGDVCSCDSPTDSACSQAADAFCVCLASLDPPPCTVQDHFNDYVECHTNRAGKRAMLLCVGGYVQGTKVDCDAASSCF